MLIVNYLVIILIILIILNIINKKYEFYKNKENDLYLINKKKYKIKINVKNKKLKNNLINYLNENKNNLSEKKIKDFLKKENLHIKDTKKSSDVKSSDVKNDKIEIMTFKTSVTSRGIEIKTLNIKNDIYYIVPKYGYYLYYSSSKKINKNLDDLKKTDNDKFVTDINSLKSELIGSLFGENQLDLISDIKNSISTSMDLVINDNSIYALLDRKKSNNPTNILYLMDIIPLKNNYLSHICPDININSNINSNNCKQTMLDLYNNDNINLYYKLNDKNNYNIINDDNKFNGCYILNNNIYYNTATSKQYKSTKKDINMCYGEMNNDSTYSKLIKTAIDMYDNLNKK